MARGRWGYDVTMKKRAQSVPVGDFLDGPSHYGQTSYISRAAFDDIDAASSASRRQDQKLLDNITSRLVNASFTQPMTSRSGRRVAATHQAAPRVTSVPSSSSRRNISRGVRDIMQSTTSDEYEFPAFPKHKSSSGGGRFSSRHNFSTEKTRSQSVPPDIHDVTRRKLKTAKDDLIGYGSPLLQTVGPTPEERKLGEFKSSVQYRYVMPDFDFTKEDSPPPRKQFKHSHVRPSYESRYSAPRFTTHVSRSRSVSEPPPTFRAPYHWSGYRRTTGGNFPSSELAVKQAKATLGRIERDLGWGEDIEDPYSTPVSHVPAGARMRTTVYTDDEPSYSYVRAPSPSPVRVRTTATTGTRHTYRPRSSSVCYGTPAANYAGYTGYTGYDATPARNSRMADLELKMALATAEDSPTPDLHRLRSMHTDAKDKMDRYKVSLDRYLPVNLGPVNDVDYEVDYKYSELKNRMPSLEPYQPGKVGTQSSYVAPYKPASTSQHRSTGGGDGRPPVWRPAVSDTRKRVREVLCKSKRDPHYYD